MEGPQIIMRKSAKRKSVIESEDEDEDPSHHLEEEGFDHYDDESDVKVQPSTVQCFFVEIFLPCTGSLGCWLFVSSIHD